MTHDDLVQRATRWLRNTLRCRVVLCELTAYTRSRETPDAIGWANAHCILVEAKTSRSDFWADALKPSRQMADLGYPALGDWRFYLTPPGLLDGLVLPWGWGWYEVHDRQVRHAAGPRYTDTAAAPLVSDKISERAMLVSALARQQGDDR